jgi:hypothetical protein
MLVIERAISMVDEITMKMWQEFENFQRIFNIKKAEKYRGLAPFRST